MTIKKPNVYIVIETKARELDAKVLLACFLARNGHQVFLGHKSAIKKELASLEPGIFFEKSAAVTKIELFKFARSFGHKVVVHDEEGLVTLNSQTYLDQRLSGEALLYCDCFFAWGEEQAQAISSRFPEHAHKIYVTGHPRLDLLKKKWSPIYSKKVSELKNKFGNFILINTKFGSCNNSIGKIAYLDFLKSSGLIKNSHDLAVREGFLEFNERLLPEFEQLVGDLSRELFDRNIVIRPHPSESMTIWNELSKKYPNVYVVREDAVYPWILASSVVVINGCTTAIEARYAGVPVITFRPIRSDRYDIPLPNMMAQEAISRGDVARIIKELPDQHSELSAHESMILGRHTLLPPEREACLNILSRLDDLRFEKRKIERSVLEALFSLLRRQKAILRWKLAPKNNTYKFSSLTSAEAKAILAKIVEVDDTFRNIKTQQFSPDCVTFHHNGKI